jgi:hypothetical protein
MRFDRQRQAGHRGHDAGMARDGDADLRRGDESCVVSTPATAPLSIRRPVTSHCWMMSTPSASAARA